MTGLFWRLIAAGLLCCVLLLAHLMADTRDRVLRMEDEVTVLVTRCRALGDCHYPEGAP